MPRVRRFLPVSPSNSACYRHVVPTLRLSEEDIYIYIYIFIFIYIFIYLFINFSMYLCVIIYVFFS